MLSTALGPVLDGSRPKEFAPTATSGAVLTRLLFEDIEMTQQSPRGRISISARRGRYDLWNRALVLDGRVELRIGSLAPVVGPQAVIFTEHPGLFFPRGRLLGDGMTGSQMFLLDEQAQLSATEAGPTMSYDDLVDRRERRVLEHLLDRVPPSLKPLAVAVLARGGNRAHPGSPQ